MAEDDHELVGRGRRFELAFEPFELGVVHVAVRAGTGDAALADGVEGDHPQARPGHERVVARRAARGRQLGRVDVGEAVPVGLGAVEEDLLVLGFGDVLAIRVGRDEGDRPGFVRQQVEQVFGGDVGEFAGECGERAFHRLYAPGRDLLEGRVGGLVPLHEAVVIAEGDVAGDGEPGGGEGQLGAIHQPGVFGPAGGCPFRFVGVVEVGAPALDVVVVVLDAGVFGGLFRTRSADTGGVRVADRVDAAVRVEGAALEQGPHPFGLVELLAVGGVAGVDREVHRGPRAVAGGNRGGAGGRKGVELTDHRVVYEGLQRLPRPEGGFDRRAQRVDELDPGRALLVGELEVGELAEVGELGAAALAAALGGAEAVFADDIRLPRADAQLDEAGRAGRAGCAGCAVGDDPLLDRRQSEGVGRRTGDRGEKGYGQRGDRCDERQSHTGQGTEKLVRIKLFATNQKSLSPGG